MDLGGDSDEMKSVGGGVIIWWAQVSSQKKKTILKLKNDANRHSGKRGGGIKK